MSQLDTILASLKQEKANLESQKANLEDQVSRLGAAINALAGVSAAPEADDGGSEETDLSPDDKYWAAKATKNAAK